MVHARVSLFCISKRKEDIMYYAAKTETPLGIATLASDGNSLIGLWLGGQQYHGGTVGGDMTENETLSVFADVKTWLRR